jgi:hypothetical protein
MYVVMFVLFILQRSAAPNTSAKMLKSVSSPPAASAGTDGATASAVATGAGGVSVTAARPPAPKIRFKFNQGYSNAVKRNVNIKEFL